MGNTGDLARENEALRERLSRLSEASLRINESLDFETVLQGALHSDRALTGSRYGVITLLDHAGRIQDFLYSGLTPEESRQFAEFPNGMLFFERLSSIGEPLRLRDFHGYVRELGLPEFRPPMAVSSPLPFLAAPLRHRGEGVGGIYVSERDRADSPHSCASSVWVMLRRLSNSETATRLSFTLGRRGGVGFIFSVPSPWVPPRLPSWIRSLRPGSG